MGAMTVGSNPMMAALDAANSKASKLKAHADTSGASGTGGTTSSSTSDSYSVDSIGSTFLSLLVQELQNQDPTSPMDSTQMVGQMISLNQLNELASIDQTLTKAYPTKTTTTAAGGTGSGSATGTGSATGSGSATGNGATGGTGSGTGSNGKVMAAPESRTATALRLLQTGAVLTQPRVSTSVTLPAF